MTSIGPKTPITLPALPSQEVTPATPVTEQHERDPRGRDQQNPATDQDVSIGQPSAPTSTLDAEAAIRESYKIFDTLTSDQIADYIRAHRGVRNL